LVIQMDEQGFGLAPIDYDHRLFTGLAERLV
jgi:hypothetical protein